MKTFDVFLNFDGNCREALDFYARVFGVEPTRVMTYDQAPGGMGEGNEGRILYSSLPVFGSNMMLSDCPAGHPHARGTNVALTLGTDDRDEIDRIFAALADGGRVFMPLGKTFFSEYYGMVADRFGLTWQLSLTPFD